ncbi:MAG: EAL domain-containing protein [Eggerthellaceae bacterium]
MAETVARFGVDPSLIEIEVTESARGRGGDLLRCVADDLRGRGFSVAVDDFGVDNANVSLFVQLEFDVLKMDRSLIWGIDATDRTMRVVSGLASLCDDLSIESVAEGIETEQQLEALKTTGCTRAQGYHREAVRYRRVRAAVHGVDAMRRECGAPFPVGALWQQHVSSMTSARLGRKIILL